jgi:hypothetical protein
MCPISALFLANLADTESSPDATYKNSNRPRHFESDL